jgi:hypothetical protein
MALLRAGVDPAVISLWLGRESTQFTKPICVLTSR